MFPWMITHGISPSTKPGESKPNLTKPYTTKQKIEKKLVNPCFRKQPVEDILFGRFLSDLQTVSELVKQTNGWK